MKRVLPAVINSAGFVRGPAGSTARKVFPEKVPDSAGRRTGFAWPMWGPILVRNLPLREHGARERFFFSGCSLKCKFCQNHQISRGGVGEEMEVHGLLARIREMIHEQGIHNLNFVTPDHFLPHAVWVACRLKKEYPEFPVLYNFSGYQSLEILKELEPYADIYLPDFKYSDRSLAGRLSACADYPGKALDAISEMVNQKGFLNCPGSEGALATKGVMVRHLILPGALENSIDALTMLFIEFGPRLAISLMSQYFPVTPQNEPEMNRPITEREFEKVYCHAKQLGFELMFVQFPEFSRRRSRKSPSFVPDFMKNQPFEV